MNEWGPLIDHDGKGCPCVGLLVRIYDFAGCVTDIIAGSECARSGVSPHKFPSAWVWEGPMDLRCVKSYRVRRPKGMDVVDEILAGVDDECYRDAAELAG